MKKLLVLILLSVVVFSCKKTEYFPLEGLTINAKGETMYVEHLGLYGTVVIDSIKLDEVGKYKFRIPRPDYPDFYALRINDKRIIFAVDSIEKIIINANYNNFHNDYMIIGSESSNTIKQLRLSVMDLQRMVNGLTDNLSQEDVNSRIEEIEEAIKTHKRMAGEYILSNLHTTASYFALYQQVNNSYLFSPYEKNDLPYWRAVSSAYNFYMPDSERTKNLYEFVLTALKHLQEEERELKNSALTEELMKQAKGYIDISLPDRNDIERSLSELEGKVVLIDFFAYELKESIDYVFTLRELYDKYHARGFEIYQVSLDRNKLLWDISTESLPWICVRDMDGAETYFASLYNVKKLPSTFLMDRQSDIVARDLSWRQLDEEIDRLLRISRK